MERRLFSLEGDEISGIILGEAITFAAGTVEEDDADRINALFSRRGMPHRVCPLQRLGRGYSKADEEEMDKNGKDGEFVEGPWAGKSYDSKHYGDGSAIQAEVAAVLRSGRLVPGWVSHRLTDIVAWRAGADRYWIFPIGNLRSALASRLGCEPEDLEDPSQDTLEYFVSLSDDGAPGGPVRTRGSQNVGSKAFRFMVRVERSEVEGPGFIDLRPPTAQEMVEFHRRAMEAEARRMEEQERREREAEERRVGMQSSSRTELDDILSADSLVCPWDDAPLHWDRRKKSIRCTANPQKCGHPKAAGRSGVQGSDLGKILSGYMKNRDYRSHDTLKRAMLAYMRLLSSLSPDAMPSTMFQLRNNLARANVGAVNSDSDVDRIMRKWMGANGIPASKWAEYRDSHFTDIHPELRRLPSKGGRVPPSRRPSMDGPMAHPFKGNRAVRGASGETAQKINPEEV